MKQQTRKDKAMYKMSITITTEADDLGELERRGHEALTIVKKSMMDAACFEREAEEFMDGSYRLQRGSDWTADLVIEDGEEG